MKIKIYSVFLLISFSLCAQMTFFVRGMGNRIGGAVTHSWCKLFSQDMDKRLKPENEAEIRLIAEKIGITPEELDVYASSQLKRQGRQGPHPHCNGNKIYFNDDWFDKWADASHVKQFVIAHELGHLKKGHGPKQIGLLLVALVSGYSAHHIFSSSGFKSLEILFISIVLYMLARSALSQKYEYEADVYALEQLGPIYGNKLIAQGAGEYLADAQYSAFDLDTHSHPRARLKGLNIPEDVSKKADEKKLTHLQKSLILSLFYYIATHPDSKDRLKKLNMSEDVSKEAGEKMLTLLKKRLILRFSDLFDATDDTVFGQNWLAICSAAWLYSVYKPVAKDYAKKLLSILDLFSVLVESITTGSFDSTVLEKEFAQEDIDQLEALVGTKGFDDSHKDKIDAFWHAIHNELEDLRMYVRYKYII